MWGMNLTYVNSGWVGGWVGGRGDGWVGLIFIQQHVYEADVDALITYSVLLHKFSTQKINNGVILVWMWQSQGMHYRVVQINQYNIIIMEDVG